jgi:hypothetical protein
MKYFLLSILVSVAFLACQPVEKKVKLENNVNFSFRQANEKFKSIALMESGDLRGMDIGSSSSKLSDLEKFLILEDDFYKHYQIDLNSYEFFDLIYFKYDGKLDEITVDIHLESDLEALEIHDDFVNWFDSKYGKSVLDYNGDLVWNKNLNDSTVIAYNLKMVSSFTDGDKAGLEKKIELGIITLAK